MVISGHIPIPNARTFLAAATASAAAGLFAFDAFHYGAKEGSVRYQAHLANQFSVVSSQRLLINGTSFYCRSKLCSCERVGSSKPVTENTTVTPKPLSRLQLLLYKSKLLPHSSLQAPRLLTPNDPLFNYPEFKRGLRKRKQDEILINKLLSSEELKEARATQNQEQLHSILDQMHKLLYGEGVTPQIREDFLVQNGCTGYSPEILEYLVELGKGRGFVEIGAGNGQWARALTDCHIGYCERNAQQVSRKTQTWEFVIAYDNMEALPLRREIYHPGTKPAHRYFYSNVKQCDLHTDVVQGYASRGRILLLVFPPPTPMALETIEAYVGAHKENDTIVYVGEGKGGANGNDELFDYLLGKTDSKWVLLKVMNVRACPGGKGYEKMFVFQRVL